MNTNEVASIVKLLRRENIEFVVAGGRHSTAGASSIEDGVVIDLRKMNSVTVNEEKKTVLVQGGCVWREVDEAAAKYGLATVGGRHQKIY
jgi:FAD/FMN-containing dehydrogenase